MEILRGVVVVIHLIGFAALFGGWIAALVGDRTITRVMHWGLAIAGVAGLALAAPWGISWPLDYTKIAVKLVILLVIGALMGIGSARQKRTGSLPSALFWLIGAFTLANAVIAVLWR